MKRSRTPPANPVKVCFCCESEQLSVPPDHITYEEKLTFTFVPRYVNKQHEGLGPRYCPTCEAQRCTNMPGRNHYHRYRYVPLINKKSAELQFLQIGRAINCIGECRESFQQPTNGLFTTAAA